MTKPIKAVQQGLAEKDAQEFEAAQKILGIEMEWHKDSYRYKTEDEILKDYKSGILKKVVTTKYYRPIFRLINPDLHSTYPPFLHKKAIKALKSICKEWKRAIKKLDPSYKDVYVPVTSLVRSIQYQNELVALGKFASENSTHCTGFTFDLDASSYYLKEGDEFKSVTDPRRKSSSTKKIVASIGNNIRSIAKDSGGKYHTKASTLQEYDKRITDELIVAAKKESLKGKTNFLVEFEGTENRVVHVCTKP